MRVGVVILPAMSWQKAAPAWRLADDMGFSHAWVYDHLLWRDLPDKPWFSAIPTLTAAAGVTRRMQLGTLVFSPNFRHPVTLAKEVVTLDDISGGRLVLGLGAGAQGAEAMMLGGPPNTRGERLERFAEFVELTDRLLRDGGRSDYCGKYYQAAGARMSPGCAQQPRLPIAVAAAGPRAMRIAARHADIWVTNGVSPQPGVHAPVVSPAVLREQTERFDAACEAEGRDRSGLRWLVLNVNQADAPLTSIDAFVDMVGCYAELGVTDVVVPFPRSEPPYVASLAVFERIAADVLPGLQQD